MFALCTTIPVFAGENNQDYTGAKAAMNGKNPLTDNTFDLISENNKSQFVVTAQDIGETTAKLKWNGEKIHLGYVVSIYNPTLKNYEKYATTNTRSISLSKLKSDTEYDFMISSGIDGEMLGSVRFVTKSLKPVVEVKDANSEEVELKISNTYNDSDLVIYRSTDGNDYKKIAKIEAEGKRTTYTDEKVKKNKTYKYKVKMESEHTDKTSKAAKAVIPEKMGLPSSTSGSTKTFAYYTAVTRRNSPQYKLLNSDECYTDKKTGIRMIDDCYCVALGSFYGSKIGTKYRIELSTGKVLKVILCDQKANRHTDSNNQYAVRNRDIMEFYVERAYIPKGVRGNYGNLEQFKGEIVSIERYNS